MLSCFSVTALHIGSRTLTVIGPDADHRGPATTRLGSFDALHSRLNR